MSALVSDVDMSAAVVDEDADAGRAVEDDEFEFEVETSIEICRINELEGSNGVMEYGSGSCVRLASRLGCSSLLRSALPFVAGRVSSN